MRVSLLVRHGRQDGHRQRRFRVPRQARGLGYQHFNVPGPSLPQRKVLAADLPAVPEIPSEREIAHRAAMRGARVFVWIVLIVLFFILTSFLPPIEPGSENRQPVKNPVAKVIPID
jgi:hypothetical protein